MERKRCLLCKYASGRANTLLFHKQDLINNIPVAELHEVFEFPPTYNIAVSSSYAPALSPILEEPEDNAANVQPGFQLSPNTARILQEFLETYPPTPSPLKCAQEAAVVSTDSTLTTSNYPNVCIVTGMWDDRSRTAKCRFPT